MDSTNDWVEVLFGHLRDSLPLTEHTFDSGGSVLCQKHWHWLLSATAKFFQQDKQNVPTSSYLIKKKEIYKRLNIKTNVTFPNCIPPVSDPGNICSLGLLLGHSCPVSFPELAVIGKLPPGLNFYRKIYWCFSAPSLEMELIILTTLFRRKKSKPFHFKRKRSTEVQTWEIKYLLVHGKKSLGTYGLNLEELLQWMFIYSSEGGRLLISFWVFYGVHTQFPGLNETWKSTFFVCDYGNVSF